MISFLKWWLLAVVVMLVCALFSLVAVEIIEWTGTLPKAWRAAAGFVASSLVFAVLLNVLFGRGR